MTTVPQTPNPAVPPCSGPEVRPDLKAYQDGELPLRRRLQVRAHLALCESCREEIAAMEPLSADLRATEKTATLPEALRRRLLENAPQTSVPPAPSSRPFWRQQPWLVFGGGSAAVAASLVAFSVLYRPMASKEMTTSAPPATAVLNTRGLKGADATKDYYAAVPVAAPAQTTESISSLSESTRQVSRAASAARMPVQIAQTEQGWRGGAASESAAAAPISAAKAAPTHGMAAADKLAASGLETDTLPALVAERQVHKEASLGLAVSGLEAASDRIEEMVRAGGGFVASNDLTTDGDGYKSAQLSLRVPTKDFESTMSALTKMGNVVSKSISGEDITDKVSDAATTEQVLENEVRETAAKLRSESMSERRTGMKEAELRMMRMQLARTRARLGLLKKMAALSTINVSLTEKAKPRQTPPPAPGFWTDMRDANRAAMHAFQAAIRVPLVLLVWILAFSPLWVPLIIAYRWASLRTASATPAMTEPEQG